MKTVSTFTTTALLSAIALFAAAPAHADAAYDQYRRVVLGDSTISAPAATASSTTQVVPGPFAQYLINTGANKADAIAAAARIGENAKLGAVVSDVAQTQLTPAQAYAKFLGNDRIAVRGAQEVGSAE